MSALAVEAGSQRAFEHVLCAAVFASRLGDLLSTYAVSPKLMLEANPLVRRFGWRFAILSLAICLVAYWHTGVAVTVFVVSALVTTSNLSRAWSARALGEERMQQTLDEAARRTSRRAAVGWTLAAGGVTVIAGALAAALCWLSGEGWGFYVSMGVAIYGAVLALHGSLAVVRLFRRTRRADRQPMELECCFCGESGDMSLHAQIAIPVEDGGTQCVYAHRACVASRVRPSTPLGFDQARLGPPIPRDSR